MATISLLPFDPTAAVLASVVRVLVDGEPGVEDVTPAGQPAWADPTATAPSGHYLFPAGWRIYTDREPDGAKMPCCIVEAPEDGKMKHTVLGGRWAVMVHVRLLVKKDYSMTTLDTVLQRCQVMLTEPLTLDAGGVQMPQERLSTAGLHVFGQQKHDNFEEVATGKLEETEDMPERALVFTVTCGLIS